MLRKKSYAFLVTTKKIVYICYEKNRRHVKTINADTKGNEHYQNPLANRPRYSSANSRRTYQSTWCKANRVYYLFEIHADNA